MRGKTVKEIRKLVSGYYKEVVPGIFPWDYNIKNVRNKYRTTVKQITLLDDHPRKLYKKFKLLLKKGNKQEISEGISYIKGYYR